MLWSAYYFKGPHFWNVWSLLVLYGFLLGDLLPSRPASATPYPVRKVLTSFGAAALALIILPAILFPNMLAVRSELGAVAVWGKGGDCPGKMVSGICLSREQGDVLEEKARSLGALLGARNGAVYLTSNSYFMPLMTGYASAAKAAGCVRAHRLACGFRRPVGSACAIESAMPAVRCTRYGFPGLGSASTVL